MTRINNNSTTHQFKLILVAFLNQEDLEDIICKTALALIPTGPFLQKKDFRPIRLGPSRAIKKVRNWNPEEPEIITPVWCMVTGKEDIPQSHGSKI